MVKRQKAGRFSFKEERLLLQMASERASIEAAAAKLRRPVSTIRKKALKMGVSLKENRRKRTI
jgi:hypothetical protein